MRRLPAPFHVANEGFAFLLEILALLALGWWGFSVHIALGFAAPIAAVVLWGLFAAPKARFKVPLPAVLAVKAVVLGAAALALAALGHHGLAIAFAVVAVANTALATADREAHMRTRP